MCIRVCDILDKVKKHILDLQILILSFITNYLILGFHSHDYERKCLLRCSAM